jgi:hypothetical protein
LNDEAEQVVDQRTWSAVVRGVAVRGLEGSMVLSKKAKKCYGIDVHQEFRMDVDEEDAFLCLVGRNVLLVILTGSSRRHEKCA